MDENARRRHKRRRATPRGGGPVYQFNYLVVDAETDSQIFESAETSRYIATGDDNPVA